MINIAWTILNRGTTPSSPYGRKTTPFLYNETWPNQQALDVLVPVSTPILEQHFRIEQLVGGVMRSTLKERLEEKDPLNTYGKALITYPAVGFTEDSIYDAFFSGSIEGGESFSLACQLIVGTSTFQVEGQDDQQYTVTNGLTSQLELPDGKYVRFRGSFDIDDSFTIAYTPFLKVPWQTILRSLELIEIEWPDNELRDIWLKDYFWLNKVSAVVMAVVEGGLN